MMDDNHNNDGHNNDGWCPEFYRLHRLTSLNGAFITVGA